MWSILLISAMFNDAQTWLVIRINCASFTWHLSEQVVFLLPELEQLLRSVWQVSGICRFPAAGIWIYMTKWIVITGLLSAERIVWHFLTISLWMVFLVLFCWSICQKILSLLDHGQSWNSQEKLPCSCRCTLTIFFYPYPQYFQRESSRRLPIISSITDEPHRPVLKIKCFSQFCEPTVEFAISFLSAIVRIWGSEEYDLFQCFLSCNSF